MNYQTPTAGSSGWERALTHGWVIANRFSTQSGYPLNIYQDRYVPLPNGGYQNYVPDLDKLRFLRAFYQLTTEPFSVQPRTLPRDGKDA